MGQVQNGTEVPLMQSVSDLCGSLAAVPSEVTDAIKKNGGEVYKCPIKAGPFSITSSHRIPAMAAFMPKPEPPKDMGGQ